METYAGKKQEFTIRIEGDKLFQSGRLSDGLKIEEMWQRVKQSGMRWPNSGLMAWKLIRNRHDHA